MGTSWSRPLCILIEGKAHGTQRERTNKALKQHSTLLLFSILILSLKRPTSHLSGLLSIGSEAVSWFDSAEKEKSLLNISSINVLFKKNRSRLNYCTQHKKWNPLQTFTCFTCWLVSKIKGCDWEEKWESKEFGWKHLYTANKPFLRLLCREFLSQVK